MYDLYFNGIGGARIYSKLIIPKEVKDKKIPFVLKFHGYQGQSSDWSRNIGIVASGMGLAMMDVRGQAGKSQDNGIFDGITVRGIKKNSIFKWSSASGLSSWDMDDECLKTPQSFYDVNLYNENTDKGSHWCCR